MYGLKNFSIRQLAVLVSVTVVILFLLFYFAFKALWSFGKETDASLARQKNEIERVETILNMKELESKASLEDYAAWNSMAEFAQSPGDDFIRDSIGPHAFESKLIDGVVILNKRAELVWSGLYRDGQVKNIDIFEQQSSEKTAKLVHKATMASSQRVQSFVEYIVYQGAPYIVTYSSICLSTGESCGYGYLFFIRKIRESFINEIEKATGVGLSIRVLEGKGAVLPDKSVKENHTFAYKEDALDDDLIIIDIAHAEKLPKFLTIPEIYALSGFAIIMFGFNVYIVSILIRPIKQAKLVLEKFQHSGGKLPLEDSFYSKEMRAFAQHINKLIARLEVKQAKLKWQSQHDPLTGLANRRYLHATLKRFLEKDCFSHLGVVLLDIDHFKQFNDNYGHLDGDKALQDVAKALASLMFPVETIACRFGGEEFCMVFASNGPIDIEAFSSLVKQEITVLSIEHAFSPTSKQITVSIGASTCEITEYDEIRQLFKLADKALYQVKASGRNHYNVLYPNDLKRQDSERQHHD